MDVEKTGDHDTGGGRLFSRFGVQRESKWDSLNPPGTETRVMILPQGKGTSLNGISLAAWVLPAQYLVYK